MAVQGKAGKRALYSLVLAPQFPSLLRLLSIFYVFLCSFTLFSFSPSSFFLPSSLCFSLLCFSLPPSFFSPSRPPFPSPPAPPGPAGRCGHGAASPPCGRPPTLRTSQGTARHGPGPPPCFGGCSPSPCFAFRGDSLLPVYTEKKKKKKI